MELMFGLVIAAIVGVIIWRLATEGRRTRPDDPVAAEVAKTRQWITNIVLVVFAVVVAVVLIGSWNNSADNARDGVELRD